MHWNLRKSLLLHRVKKNLSVKPGKRTRQSLQLWANGPCQREFPKGLLEMQRKKRNLEPKMETEFCFFPLISARPQIVSRELNDTCILLSSPKHDQDKEDAPPQFTYSVELLNSPGFNEYA